MTPPILAFAGKYRFLSNFYPAPVFYEHRLWPTAEHAYQSAKTTDDYQRQRIWCVSSPGIAKRLGQSLVLRSDWENVKRSIMETILRSKFEAGTKLGDMLEATRDARLVEGNTWGDTYWGECPLGHGSNHLGLLLMKIRTDIECTGL